jgi:uncharacterized protein (DUF983 family)
MTDTSFSPPSPFITGLTCTCPRCGKGKLFSGFLALAENCDVCGLSYDFANSGDGPAVFVIFTVAPVVIVLAVIFEALVHPAPYVHLFVWIPVTVILSLALLRPFKAIMIALQYRNDAKEGRLE